MTEHVIVSDAGGIRTIRMNRPDKKNALTLAMYDAMTAALEGANTSDGIRCVLIAGVSGAYLLFFPSARVVTLVPIFLFLQVMEIPAVVYLLFWFLWQFFSGVASFHSTSGGVAPGVRRDKNELAKIRRSKKSSPHGLIVGRLHLSG